MRFRSLGPTPGAVPAIAVLAVLVACSGPREVPGGDRPIPAAPQERFAPPVASVGTVQVYRTGGEDTLPVLNASSGETLTLAFDLVDESPRPLSVWFYHADRSWRRDLQPGEALESFHRDDLFDYRASRATQLPYVHYRYAFPNASIRFRVSGNWVLRVTEQGDEEAVLFERPFLVSEQAVPIRFGVEPVMVAGASYPSLQPTLGFAPPERLSGNAYDYDACFVRGGILSAARCDARMDLAPMPSVRFTLDAETALRPRPDDGYLDLSDLRIGPRVVSTDLSAVPFRAALEPDYMRFPGSLDNPMLGANPVIDGTVPLPEPSLGAEYVRVRFSFVPDPERELPGSVHVIGTFDGWNPMSSNRMEWNPTTARYEAEVLLKQGRHAYRYAFSDERVATEVNESSPPKSDDMISAFVYFRDVRLATDRLVASVSVRQR